MMPANRRLTAALVALCLLVPTLAVAGDVLVQDAWARATPPGMSVSAAYMKIVGGAQDDRLVGASTERASMTQIHVVTAEGGMARMRPVDGVDVPARKTVSLAPQGTHLMLMDLSAPLVPGEHFRVTLTFERAGKVDVDVEVRSPDDSAPPVH